MELFLFEPTLYKERYGCQNISVDAVPLKERQQLVNGLITLAIYALLEPLSILCTISLFRHRSDNSCYSLMFVTALVDTLNLNLTGLLTAVLGIAGVMFCEAPTLVYVSGCVVQSLWAVQTDLNMVLAVNRCVEYLAPWTAEFLFSGQRTWIWLGVLFAHWLFYASQINLIFVPMYFNWFYNPYTGYRNDLNNAYIYPMDLTQNVVAGIAIPAIYTLFCVLYFLKLWAFREHTTITAEHKMIFVQILLISALNVSAVGCFMLMVFGIDAYWVDLAEMYSWNLLHGLPSVIYLASNRTLRKDILHMLSKVVQILFSGCENTSQKSELKKQSTCSVSVLVGGGGGEGQSNKNGEKIFSIGSSENIQEAKNLTASQFQSLSSTSYDVPVKSSVSGEENSSQTKKMNEHSKKIGIIKNSSQNLQNSNMTGNNKGREKRRIAWQ